MCYIRNSSKIQSCVDESHRRVVQPFCSHLTYRTEELFIEIGCGDREARVTIGGDVSMLNIAEDQSTQMP